MLSEEDYELLIDIADINYDSTPYLRYGQALMIALYDIDEKLYDEVQANDFDPFFDNTKVNEFLNFLRGDK